MNSPYNQAVDVVLQALKMRRALSSTPLPASRENIAKLGLPITAGQRETERAATSIVAEAEPVIGKQAAYSAPVATAPPAAPMPRVESSPIPRPAAPAAPEARPLSKAQQLEKLKATVLPCTKCEHLARFRHTVVFGVGNPEAELMFVGEAPGADEDLQGEPFVGRAGQLLTKIIETMGFKRSDVYIANVLKCRPDMPPGSSGNRQPTSEEMATCLPFLLQQIQIIRPKVIVALGATAMKGLFPDFESITKSRGKWKEFENTPVMPTYHPSYLLRNQALAVKRQVWEDMLQVKEKLGQPISDRDRRYFLPKSQ